MTMTVIIYELRRENRALSAREPMWRGRHAKLSEIVRRASPSSAARCAGFVFLVVVCHFVFANILCKFERAAKVQWTVHHA